MTFSNPVNSALVDGFKKETNSRRDSLIQTPNKRLTFQQLPLRPNDPPFSAWGLWGDTDELGTLNLLTPDTVKNALNDVVYGLTITLNLPLGSPSRPMNPVRKPCVHRIIEKGRSNDDELDINTQGSSHFDGLRHYPYQDPLLYYNGITQDEISSTTKIGIHNAATRGIAGRGVLLDWYRYAQSKGIEVDAFSRQSIPLSDLLAVARQQNVVFRQGDILLVRTGWTQQYSNLLEAAALALPDREVRASIGIEASRDMMKWHWDNGFAAVASDTVAYESWPSPRKEGVSLHEVFLSGWGMMIGECWDLEALSRECERLGKWTFFLTSSCLNVSGGVASPSNAMALL